MKVPPYAQPVAVKLDVNGRQVMFDMSDSSVLSPNFFDSVDWVFKRSLRSDWNPHDSGSTKVRPFGLNYMVMQDGFSWFPIKRALAFPRASGWPKHVARALDSPNWFHYSPRRSMIELGPPRNLSDMKVLFLARVWDTANDDHFDLSHELREDRIQVNEMRVRCIRSLRAEFGSRALVGLVPDNFAQIHYPDCIIDNRLTEKKRYLQLLADYPVCITTTGLHGSIGWKFAEYVATSRAIVSEPLNHQIPGKFARGENYLSFEDANSCLEAVSVLLDNPYYCLQMMQQNSDYYQKFLRPDELVWNCLKQVGSHTEPQSKPRK
ncbi:MAG: hypothetical protein AAF749_07255 [Pseudomonadota bacterium]